MGVHYVGLVIDSSLKSDRTEISVDFLALREGIRYGHLAIVQKAHGGAVFGYARLQLVASI